MNDTELLTITRTKCNPFGLTLSAVRYQQGEEKTATTKMTDKNGLRMRNEKEKLKEKRFSFFADPQERKAKSLPALHTLSSRTCRHKPKLAKECNIHPTK